MVRYGTDETGDWRTANLLKTYRRWCPTIEGVAFVLSSLTQQALVGWELVSPRIVCAQFLTRKKEIKLNVIQCCAPTNEADEDQKDTFYQQLQDVVDSKDNKDITIEMGDFNAKIGADNTSYEDTMGTQGVVCTTKVYLYTRT